MSCNLREIQRTTADFGHRLMLAIPASRMHFMLSEKMLLATGNANRPKRKAAANTQAVTMSPPLTRVIWYSWSSIFLCPLPAFRQSSYSLSRTVPFNVSVAGPSTSTTARCRLRVAFVTTIREKASGQRSAAKPTGLKPINKQRYPRQPFMLSISRRIFTRPSWG